MNYYVMQVVRDSGTYNYLFQIFGDETPEAVALDYVRKMKGELIGVISLGEFLQDDLMELSACV